MQPWSGHPGEPAGGGRVCGAGAQGGASVYASWNGATEVASWKVLAGASPSALKPVGGAPRSGFETAIAAPGVGAGGYVAVQALDAAGAVIGTSATVKIAGQA